MNRQDPCAGVEPKHTGGCTCRCNACDGGHHCHNIGSGCKVKP
ncbi:EGF-like domain-containing protein [Mycolicibacterium rhodesiae JS60]|nr:EGF-like domain-containing protein [Mycolicibacterium rhodesiae JS60]